MGQATIDVEFKVNGLDLDETIEKFREVKNLLSEIGVDDAGLKEFANSLNPYIVNNINQNLGMRL